MPHKHPFGHVIYRRMAHDHPVITHGQSIYLYDDEGNSYIDGSGGALVVNAGHGIESIANAIAQQAADVAYIHPTMFTSSVLEQYTQALCEFLPLSDGRSYPVTSGSEAVETAIKLARQIQVAKGESNRHIVISRWMSYHGATLGALAVTGKEKMRNLYLPMFKDVPHIPPPYCYRCPYDLTHPDCDLRCAQALEDKITELGTEHIAAFLAEPISGATIGAVVPPDGYWPRIREICDRYGVLLIADEIMTGMGRTGKWFAVQHWDLEADILTLGKGTSSGYYPLGVTATRGAYVDLIAENSGDFVHGGTYSHHVVGAAAGLATLKYLQDHHLLKEVNKKGKFLERTLRKTLSEQPFVGDIRGKGLMWGVELVHDKATKKPFNPAHKIAEQIADEALTRGLIIYPGSGSVDGTAGDHFMIGPPFCINEIEIEEMIRILNTSLQTIFARSE